jgi:hypothetical protein
VKSRVKLSNNGLFRSKSRDKDDPLPNFEAIIYFNKDNNPEILRKNKRIPYSPVLLLFSV